jgi:hypothetical protein
MLDNKLIDKHGKEAYSWQKSDYKCESCPVILQEYMLSGSLMVAMGTITQDFSGTTVTVQSLQLCVPRVCVSNVEHVWRAYATVFTQMIVLGKSKYQILKLFQGSVDKH